MEYRALGRTGLKVSQLCLGTMMFGGKTEEQASFRIIDHAINEGVNFIDTADVYASKRSRARVNGTTSSSPLNSTSPTPRTGMPEASVAGT